MEPGALDATPQLILHCIYEMHIRKAYEMHRLNRIKYMDSIYGFGAWIGCMDSNYGFDNHIPCMHSLYAFPICN